MNLDFSIKAGINTRPRSHEANYLSPSIVKQMCTDIHIADTSIYGATNSTVRMYIRFN